MSGRTAATLGFLVDGCREIARKANRMGLRRSLASKDRERAQALTRLGQTAWQAKIDLTDVADLRGRLEQLDVRASDASATATRLDAERADLQSRRATEVARFDALLAPARAAQSDADAATRAARAALAERDAAIRAIETRVAALTKALSNPGDGGGSAADQKQQIVAEQKALTDQAATETAVKMRLSEDVNERDVLSQRRAAETARIAAEYKAALQPIDADLARLQQASAAAARESATIGRDQRDRFRELGAVVYDRRPADPVLTECVQAVAAVDAGRAATQAAIDESLRLTSVMARGTMPKFWAVVLLLPVAITAVVYGARYTPFRTGRDPVAAPIKATSSTTAPSAALNTVAADELRKDAAVLAFMNSRTDRGRRTEAVAILAADLSALGSSVDRSALPLLLTILERGEPELRAAAAHAIGMIGVSSAEVPALTRALNDPIPTVRNAVVEVLGQVPDPGARLLAQRANLGTRDASRSGDSPLTPTVAPDAAALGVAIYPNAMFLAFASDLDIGRVSYSSSDPAQKVVDFYAARASGRSPVGGEEFTRLYFSGSAGDPTGAKALSAENEAWFKQALAANMPDEKIRAEAERQALRILSLPLVRYAEPTVYGAPVFIALDVSAVEGRPRAARYIVVFEDHSLGRTGFEYHLPADAIRR